MALHSQCCFDECIIKVAEFVLMCRNVCGWQNVDGKPAERPRLADLGSKLVWAGEGFPSWVDQVWQLSSSWTRPGCWVHRHEKTLLQTKSWTWRAPWMPPGNCGRRQHALTRCSRWSWRYVIKYELMRPHETSWDLMSSWAHELMSSYLL